MRDKFEMFDELLNIETAHKLSNHEVVKLAAASKSRWICFKPIVEVRKLLHQVVRGEHDAVQSTLLQDMNLILKRGKVIDRSGREFENISAFEYAIWALDKHMWTTMLACIPKIEESATIFAKLIAQYHQVSTVGIIYMLNGKTISETHFDFENTIIKALQRHENLIVPNRAVGEVLKTEIKAAHQWVKEVGAAQKLLPMHVIDEYSSNEAFSPTPKFISPPKPSCKFFNIRKKNNEKWFGPGTNLAVHFAIYKGDERYARDRIKGGTLGQNLVDLDAMKTLFVARRKDFINLKSQLEECATLNNHQQVVSMLPTWWYP